MQENTMAGVSSFRKKWVAKTRRKTSKMSHYSRPPDGDRVKPVTRAKIPVTKKVTYLPSDLPTYLPTYLSHALPSLDRLVPVDRGKAGKSAASKRPISTVRWDLRQVATYRTR
jgi:hypothetical protein